jgi:DNA-binding PadR family transcriptional regulator
LPLTAAVLHILLALAEGDRHGYAIAKDVEAATNGEIRMGPGTLYGSIQRMLAAELIEESARRPKADEEDARQRYYYKMTTLGRRVLHLELERLGRIVTLAHTKRVLRGPEPA